MENNILVEINGYLKSIQKMIKFFYNVLWVFLGLFIITLIIMFVNY